MTENEVTICSKDTALCGLALLEEDFPCKKSDSIKQEEEKMLKGDNKQNLTEFVQPIARTLLKKKMKIIGWSENLLQNASGEVSSFFFLIFNLTIKLCTTS